VVNVNSNGFTIGFAAASCIISGVLLASANLGLKDLQDLNVKIDKQRSVLISAGLIDNSADKNEIASWFDNAEGAPAMSTYIIKVESGKKDESVAVTDFQKKPKLYPEHQIVFESKKEGQECLILPIEAKGLWGKMKGYIALAGNGNDVLGICFYDHKETPGLGAEVTEAWWTDQFKKSENKSILKTVGDYSADSFVGIEVKKGGLKSAGPNEVDGISGATITTKGVSEVLTTALRETYAEFLKNRRS
jgi:Na+-transporting NADH:ubiquinone oxidoreductase subunit C